MSETGGKISVLFLCTGNSCRSQMAEGFARQIKGNTIQAYSAGIDPHGMNPRAGAGIGECDQPVDLSRRSGDRRASGSALLARHARRGVSLTTFS